MARLKVYNQAFRTKRAEYKKTEAGKLAEQRYRKKSATKQRLERNRLKSRYNLTPEQVEEMKKQQNHMCAICSETPKHWHIDHCHSTNKVRGMLCGPCNMALGLMKDDAERLNRAARYLDV